MRGLFGVLTGVFCLLMATTGGHATMRTQTVDYQVGDTAMQGMLVWDDAVQTPRPGLLMIPNWRGIYDDTLGFAKQIAGRDYVIFMGDMYGKATRPQSVDEAKAATAPLYADRALMRERVGAAFEQLQTLTRQQAAPIDASRLAAIGFCFGGTSVLDLARMGTDLAAVVSFHGGLSTDDATQARNIKAWVLALNGADDMGTKPDVPAFNEEMRQSSAPWEYVAYGGAVHCFAEPWAHSRGCMYNEPVARRAFARMRAWLDEAFGAR